MLEQLKNQKYLNLETFRRNGQGIRTPVWFVQEGEVLYVRTMANSGKVKRVRNNGKVNIAPCKADGTLLGDWIPAQAVEVQGGETANLVDRLQDKKYGFQKKIFAFVGRLQGRKDVILKITLAG